MVPLTAAYVDQVRAFLHCSFDRPGKVELGEVTLLVVLEYGENETRHRRAIPQTEVPGCPKIRLDTWVPWDAIGPEEAASLTKVFRRVTAASLKAGMREVDGPVEYGDAYFRVAQRLGLE